MSQESIVPSIDRSWLITVSVDEIGSNYSMRVNDSTLVSVLMKDLIEIIDLKFDWMEFGLWCDMKKLWLLPKSANLLSFSLESQHKVHFVRRYRMVNIQLPDLQIRPILLDLSKTVFQTNHIVCRKMGIRHHEELSFQYRNAEICKNRSSSMMSMKRTTNYASQQNIIRSNWSLVKGSTHFTPLPKKRDVSSFFRSFSNPNSDNSPKIRRRAPTSNNSPSTCFSTYDSVVAKSVNDTLYFASFENSKFANSPEMTYDQAVKSGYVLLFKSYRERSLLRLPWMISELTLMEQGIENYEKILLLMRYKYHNYYFMDDKYDGIRINQIFRQAYWSVMSCETDCSEDESLILGGILLQINKSLEKEKNFEERDSEVAKKEDLEEEITTILDKLHLELLGRNDDKGLTTSVDVSGTIHIVRYPKRFFNSFEKHFAEIKNNGIHLFPKQSSSVKGKPTEIIPIIGNEVEIRVKCSKKEYFLLEIFNLQYDYESMNKENKIIEKYKFRFFDKNEFIRWAASCRLLSKSIDFTNIDNFQYEYNVVTNILDMKRPLQISRVETMNGKDEQINLSDFVSPKINKPFKKKFIVEKIVKFQKSCGHYSSMQAKIAYIKCWLTLHNAGICYFQVSRNKSPEKELLGIGYNKLLLGNLENGKLLKMWELSKLITWNTNWELEHSVLDFPTEKLELGFSNISDCQMFHEYLGGYLFIMMRNSEKYSDLSEKTFRKLTARNLPKT